MKADKIEALDFLGMPRKCFIIPVYQRNYNWYKNQCEKLFEDIENIIKNDFKITHFIGTIVYIEGEKGYEHTDCIIVDGQQRITTISLLLKAIMDSLDENEKDLKSEINEEYLLNKRIKDEKNKVNFMQR